MATTAAPYGFWATNPTKKLAHWVYLLGQPLSRNRVFQNFSGEPPPLTLLHDIDQLFVCLVQVWSFYHFQIKSYDFGLYMLIETQL